MNENRRVRTFDIYCLSKFKVCNTLLTTVTMLCRFPELLHVVKGSLYPLVNISTFPSPPYSPASGNHHFHYTTMNLTFFYIPHTRYHGIFISLGWPYLT